MRKLAAIFFLSLLVFSNWGYRWVFYSLEQKATSRLEAQIDAGSYSDEQLLEIKIPLSMPYYSDRPYEQAYGETKWEGNHYRYVKRKVSHDTLYLLCIPHTEKDQLVSAEQDVWKLLNDTGNGNPNKKQQTPAYVKLILSEFTRATASLPELNNSLLCNTYLTYNSNCRPQYEPPTDTRPPRA